MAYCFAHVVQVWRKRNARPERKPAGGRLALACLVAGIILLPASVVHRELTRSEGVLTSEGLFAVRTGEDQDVEWLRETDSVSTGEPLARFGSGPHSARAEELHARLARAEAERDVLALLPLAPDPELTRRHQAACQARIQAQQELSQALIAAEASERDLTAQFFAKKEALAKVELSLTERRKELDRATLRSEHARLLLAMLSKLSGGGSISSTEYQDQLKASRDADIELASLKQELKDLVAQKEEFRSQMETLEAGRSNSASPLRKQVTALTTRVSLLDVEEAELKAKLAKDIDRSEKLRKAERAQASAKVREQQAGVDGIVREREVTAPFSGNLAYRAASPKTVRPRGTLMVLAPENGFRLTARMSHSDADALREGAEVVIELGEDSPERRIPARFRKTESLAHEPGYAALQLECQPPPETVRRLAEGEKLTVSFTWHPPLIDLWSFRVGVLLVVGGLVGLLMKGRLGARGQIQTGNWPEGVVVVVPNVRAGEQLEVHALESPHDSPEWCRGGKPHYAEHLAVANRSPNWLGVAKLLARLRSLRRPVREPARSDRFHHLRQTLDAQASMPHNSLPRLTSARS